jgi:thiol-disulfide isomerase/thioredoxin
MTLASLKRLALLCGATALCGCGTDATLQTTHVSSTPAEVVEAAPAQTPKPDATAEAAPADRPEETASQPAVTPVDLAAAAPDGPAGAADAVRLQRLSWEQFKSQVAANPDAKYTLVDVWATNCGPCKENFPHLVEMHKKYADKGLAVASLSLDDRENAKAVEEAEEFLRQKGATFTNVLLDEEADAGYEFLNINAIPAVFVFGPDGKEVKRFTMDDPDNQFTYEQVEKEVAALLDAPVPAEPAR